ncbi:unnamed protein product [Microthlaspi erraticum]|uniref:Uncharacterized protein n=1 Tax=Microthlaspi erraticum TaxID=1685480 RepID=A0A6D2K102_9BRAS|nr:unnamed protein product [Microthlaspi erraticum]
MANSAWIEAYPSGRCEYLHFEGSDHRPIITFFYPTKNKRKGLFRYDRSLRNNEEVKLIVEKAWKTYPNANIDHRISNCRRAIIQWHRQNHRNSQQRIEMKRKELEEAMSSNVSSDNLIFQINKELKESYQAEEEYWRQRSRQMWLSLGDKNSGYFHAATRGRRARNNISVIEDENGSPVYEEESIGKVITSYFADMFTSENGDRAETVNQSLSSKISEETNAKLIQIPTPEEVSAAIFSIHPDKAPGPDGFSASFFHSNWETVGKDIIQEVQLFFTSGILPRARLHPILNELVSENQSAFVPGRAISDNVMITHEILHFLKISKAKKRGAMAIKTDMTKAYDRVEWDFIKLVLERLGFHTKWIGWIMQCVTSVTFQFLINGTAVGFVQPSRGIRQGDPLSPYLFILCSEVLSGLCHKAQANGQITGVRIATRGPQVNHLLFADDTMFFCKSNEKTCAALKEVLRKYEEASGQKISCQKSVITFSKQTPEYVKRRVKRDLGINQEGGQGKYLGLPEAFGRKKKDLFNAVVDRIRQRAISWSSKQLSCAGKLVMLKSVLSSMPTYSMSCFKLPVKLCQRIQSVLTCFWWDANDGKRKMCWIAWDKLTLGKREGGLGLRDIQSFNDALLSKLSWRILSNQQCLLAKILKGKYFPNTSFLECEASEGSHGWKGITIGRDLLKEKLGRVIGNGKATCVWDDPWLSTKEPRRPMGPAPELAKNLKVADLMLASGEWNEEKISEILPLHREEILCIVPGSFDKEDKLAWLPQDSGEYSVKSGYYTARARKFPDNLPTTTTEFNWITEVWDGNFAPKLKIFLWKAVQGALPVGDNLAIRGMTFQAACIHCGRPESTLHMLFHCNLAQEVWSMAPFRNQISSGGIMNLKAGIKVLNVLISLPPMGLRTGTLAPWIMWSIWMSRNNRIFNNRTASAQETLDLALIRAREWQEAQEKPITGKLKSRSTRAPIPPRFIRCQTDGAWNELEKSGGMAWTFHHSNNQLITQRAIARRNIASPLIAEGLAIRNALVHALDLGFTSLHVASDSQQIIKAINSGGQTSEVFGILQDITHLALSFTEIVFVSISRENNVVADVLAKHSLRDFLVVAGLNRS